MKFKT